MLARLASRWLRLGPRTHRFEVVRGVPIALADGVTLVHDHYRPRTSERLPTILVRTPYDRADFLAAFWYHRFAERGYHVIVQDCRGRFGSSGSFEPFAHERADGLATIAWIGEQPWFDGRLGMWGASYNGFTQWAVADSPALRAIAPLNTSSDFHASFFPGGSVTLDTLVSWIVFTADARDVGGRVLPALRRVMESNRRRARARWNALPAGRLDEDTLAAPVEFFRTSCAELPRDHDYWAARRHSERVPETHAAVHLMSGWYDVFLVDTLADYRRLCAAGKPPHLTIGPFSHSEMRTQLFTLQLGLAWFARTLKGEAPPVPDLPVRVFVTGRDEWRDLPAWPPPAAPQTYHLGAGGALLDAPPAEAPPTRYRYDPADPTPSVGGAALFGPAVVDNRALEARPDVRTFTGPPLAAPLEVVGAPRLVAYVRCSLEHFDVFARLCEVEASGRSLNRCDAIVRISPGRTTLGADGCVRVELELSPIAHRFAAGSRLRLQLASGAHPRFVRNPGTGVVALEAVELRAADLEIHHDAEHPSALVLPCSS